MEISDFLIGKPGPGTLSEAMAKRLPVIVQRNAWTMAHELYNAEWIEEIGAGLVIGSFAKEIEAAVKKLLAPANYERYRAGAAATANRAVYEIPNMLDSILSERRQDRGYDSSARSLPESARSA